MLANSFNCFALIPVRVFFPARFRASSAPMNCCWAIDVDGMPEVDMETKWAQRWPMITLLALAVGIAIGYAVKAIGAKKIVADLEAEIAKLRGKPQGS